MIPKKATFLVPILAISLPLPVVAAQMSSPHFIMDQVNFASANALVSSRDGKPPVISTESPRVSVLTPTTATITWETDKKSSSSVEYGTTASYGSVAGTKDSVTSHTVTLNGLTEETTYHYKVVSEDVYNMSASSGDFTFTTPAQTEFKEISISQVTYTSALVTVIGGGVSSIQVTYGNSPSESSRKKAETVTGTTEQNFPLKDLAPGTKYYVTVEGTDEKGGSVKVPALTFTTTPEPSIQEFSITAASPNQLIATVTTATPTSVTIAYQSERETALGSVGDTVLATTHTLPIAKLFGNTEYRLTATVVDAGGKRFTSDTKTVSTLMDSLPPVLSDPSVSVGKAGDQIVSTAKWEADEPVTSQLIVTSKVNPNDTVTVNGASTFAVNQSLTVSGLSPKTPYTLQAISKDAAGNISKKEVQFVTPSVHKSIFDLITQSLSRLIDPLAKLIKSF